MMAETPVPLAILFGQTDAAVTKDTSVVHWDGRQKKQTSSETTADAYVDRVSALSVQTLNEMQVAAGNRNGELIVASLLSQHASHGSQIQTITPAAARGELEYIDADATPPVDAQMVTHERLYLADTSHLKAGAIPENCCEYPDSRTGLERQNVAEEV